MSMYNCCVCLVMQGIMNFQKFNNVGFIKISHISTPFDTL